MQNLEVCLLVEGNPISYWWKLIHLQAEVSVTHPDAYLALCVHLHVFLRKENT